MKLYRFRTPAGIYGLSVYKLSTRDLEDIDNHSLDRWQIITFIHKPRDLPAIPKGACIPVNLKGDG
jgi:hypothetical protein